MHATGGEFRSCVAPAESAITTTFIKQPSESTIRQWKTLSSPHGDQSALELRCRHLRTLRHLVADDSRMSKYDQKTYYRCHRRDKAEIPRCQ